MKINPSAMLFGLKQSKNNQQVKLATPVDTELRLNDELSKLATDTFQKSATSETEPTYTKPLTMSASKIDLSKTIDEAMREKAIALGELYLPGGSVPQAVEKMLSPYDRLMSDISQQQPALADKDWGIAINQSGKLEATGALTDNEKEFLETKLNNTEALASAINEFKSSYLKNIVFENKGWGRFNVTEENFADVFDFKEMLEASRSDEGFNKTWGYKTSWLKLYDNVSAQLSMNTTRK
ncbi:hypothetical protein [Pseudoalteromonas sp. L21]|uniref:hypothetical protein n=1 Tax=Pseudoalteromonas sp. L21 TaxID=1539746 RepID=UPI001F36ECF1|nr:hypothetical protein [Pseudoalteromonas sp. L21]MCF7517706.1 hypothetical protein [Pseudoalteromonas sp. L21]